jgi:tetratricopeptide (TPR) repeat protein
MDNLLMLLKHTDNLNDALIVEEGIKEIWKVHGDEEMRWSLEDANAALLRGDKSSSLAYLDKIVQKDSSYFEAWNKKATCHYLLGDTNMSIETAHMAKSYNANHFQALSGLGLVHYDASRYKSAAKFFRKSLRIDPWSPVSSRLLMCLDMLERLDLDEGGKE